MALAQDFEAVVDSLPDDWTDLELDLRIADETRYVDAAVMLSQVNAQPYSRADWHWRINVAHRFGHAAAAETVRGVLSKLDREGIAGELRVRDAQEGRAEVVQMVGAAREHPPRLPAAAQPLELSRSGSRTREKDWITEAAGWRRSAPG